MAEKLDPRQVGPGTEGLNDRGEFFTDMSAPRIRGVCFDG